MWLLLLLYGIYSKFYLFVVYLTTLFFSDSDYIASNEENFPMIVYFIILHLFTNKCHYRIFIRASEVRSPAEAIDFSSSLSVHTGSGTHPASFIQWIPEVLSPGVKRGRGLTLTTQPRVVPKWMSRSYTSSPPAHLHRCVVGLLYLYSIWFYCLFWPSVTAFPYPQ
jgi:hypothetical protein